MRNTVVIDCFPESAARYREGWAVVAVDVVRATTTAITAVAAGYRCFPVPTIEAAVELASQLGSALLAGEQRGLMPPGFDLNNSPTDLLARADLGRPVILLSSSGTRLLHEAAKYSNTFLACFRNYPSIVGHLAGNFRNVAVIGAGSRGEFREEDQMCCAWITESLIRSGYTPKDTRTTAIVERWCNEPVHAWLRGKSAEYLRNSGQTKDLTYIINNVADLSELFVMQDGEVVKTVGQKSRSAAVA